MQKDLMHQIKMMMNSLTLLSATLNKQMKYIYYNNEGYNRSQIFSLKLPSAWQNKNDDKESAVLGETLKNELTKIGAVENTTLASDNIQNLRFSFGGGIGWSGKAENQEQPFTPLSVDADFNKIFKLKLKEPFEYTFMDEEFANMYKAEIKTSKLISAFSALAIFLCCLGLF
ncbi:MAG: hypothetical protein IT249_06865 [Chitinophagaceae bacterium]|nr:hypothetical protein [Chitinophagaceae bacterium]